ncbi:MAG: hypothetical protein EBQ95_04505 [Gammaproteobacteria bacterium]|nr:hypothetical protein [Gammaproteobacteria bacterium]
MKAKFLLKLIFCITLVFTTCCCVADDNLPSPFLLNQLNTSQDMWTITGLLQNEQDESYGFTFNIQRNGPAYHVFAAIMDIHQKKELWHQEENGILATSDQPVEKLGHFFWKYSNINSSLIVGYEDNKQQVFNLKLDLLEPTVVTKTAKLTPDMKIQQFWSGQINGHVNINEKEQFVTSREMWLQQIWQHQSGHHPKMFQELMCKFQDGSSLFALQIPEKNALKANIAGHFNAQGDKQTISQFINLYPSQEKNYNVILKDSKKVLHLQSLYQTKNYQALFGYIPHATMHGFCLYQSNPWDALIPQNRPHKPRFESKHENILQKTFALGKKNFKMPINLKNKSTS